MQDVLYLGIIIAFFVLAVAFVYACDLIIGPDEEVLVEGADEGAEIGGRAA
jgi:hypothetical protein